MRRRAGRNAAALLAMLLAGGTALLGVSREEMQRYGFGQEVSRSAREGTLRALPEPDGKRPIPPLPVLPKATELPRRAIPSPVRPKVDFELVPRAGAPAAGVAPALAARPDPLVEELFPGQMRSAYAGNETCIACHGKKAHDQAHSLFGLVKADKTVPAERRGCEGCHGPGSEHARGLGTITNPAKLDHLAISKLCFSCHADKRLVKRMEWHVTGHQEAFVSCTTCHSVHAPRWKKALADEPDRLCLSCHQDLVAQLRLRSHHPVKAERIDPLSSMREGKVRCIDCHQAYSARNGADLLRRDGKELCTQCHAAFRGPFLFEHDAGSGDLTHQCSTCHMPHGSPNRDLLVIPDRGLCLRCHTDRITHRPGPSCVNAQCHRDIHGSNLNQLFLPR